MLKKCTYISLLLTLSIGILAQVSPEKSVLILIDLQEISTIYNMNSSKSDQLIKSANEAIGIARPMDVIFIVSDLNVLSVSLKGNKKESSQHLDLDERLTRKMNDRVLIKKSSSAFSLQELNNYLKNENIKDIYMAGIMLGDCLYSTALDGVERGYNIHIIREAVTANRESKVGKFLNELIADGVDVLSLDEFREGTYY